jgi:polar amino acid transport system substrate-binding protein
MEDENGNIVGFDIDLAREFTRWLGVRLQVTDTEWDDLLPNLANGRCDLVMSGMTITSARMLRATYSNPYYAGGLAIVVNNRHRGRINSFRDINDPSIRVAVRAGVSAEDIMRTFFKRANLMVINDEDEAVLRRVVDGRADVFVYDLPFLEAMQHVYANQAFLIRDTFTYEPFGAAARRGSDLPAEFNKFLDHIRETGLYDQLYKKWFN